MTHFVQRHIDRIMTTARGPVGARIVHVDYYALVRDPVAQMREIYRRLDIDFTGEVQRAVAAWHRDNPINARGANVYGSGEFGLDEASLARQFAPYMEHFAIRREGDADDRQDD